MTYKESFIKFMVDCGVLTFGEFTLKSGRVAPYFVNAGNYNTGEHLAKLGEYYAACIQENNIPVQTLFGPAYKGIPLSVSAAVALYHKYGKSVHYCFDRKDVKDHGEGGMFVGKHVREVYPKLKGAADVNITGMVITVDRMERGLNSDKSAVQEVKAEFGIDVYPIVTMADIIDAIANDIVPGKEYLDKMIAYREQYGVCK